MKRNHGLISSHLKTLWLICFFLLPLFSFATVRYVPSQYANIQAAINAAVSGDEIIVSPGTYGNINFLGKNIILRSTDPTNPSVVASTIIDGSSDYHTPGVTFLGTESSSCVLSGFTITNGFAQRGGGINGNGTLATIQNNSITTNTAWSYLYSSAHGGGLYDCDGTIQNNTISGNSSSGVGGGLYLCDGTIQNNTISSNLSLTHSGGLAYCNGTIQNNTISGNSADWGGGLTWCFGIIQNNTISGNSALGHGGGLFQCYATIQNNTISSNSASRDGGGLYDCDGTIQNNTISGNSASDDGGGLYYCDGTIQNNIISGNSAQNSGGGLYFCWAIIQNNAILDNSAGYSGGGLYNCDRIIQNNTISGNSAQNSGGGLSRCDNTIQNNIISGNSASYWGGGLYNCWATIQNNTISDNSAPYGGGMCNCGSYIINCIVTNNENYGFYETYGAADPAEMEYCNIYGNTDGDYYDYDTAASYTGDEINNLSEVHDCMSADPLFVDPNNGDFHLQPLSPCIDAGCNIPDLTEDFEGDPRPFDAVRWESRGDGSDFDIGADEFIERSTSAKLWQLYQ